MIDKTYNVLFIGTDNSVRSIMAEAILNQISVGRFRAFSAGSQPAGQVHPQTIRLLKSLNHDTTKLRSKHWHEFMTEDTHRFDFVFTVCDKVAEEPCPVWSGQPILAHWGVEDPAMLYADDERVQKLFFDTYMMLKRRIELLCNLPVAKLDAIHLKHRLDEIVSSNQPHQYTSNP